jgi:hypothetical protein
VRKLAQKTSGVSALCASLTKKTGQVLVRTLSAPQAAETQ